MDVHIDFVSDPIPPADAWADNVSTPHAPEALDLDALVAQYIAKGGKVQEVAQGATSQPLNGAAAFNATFYASANVPQAVLHARAQHQKNVDSRFADRAYKGDPALVEQLGRLLESQPPRKDILTTMRMSDDRLQRLLRMHFKDDPRADAYRKMPHEKRHELTNPHDAAMAKTIGDSLAAGRTMTQTSTLTGYSPNTIRRIVKKYDLEIKVRRKRGHVVELVE